MLAEEPRAARFDVWLLLSVTYADANGRGADLEGVRFVAELLGHAPRDEKAVLEALHVLRDSELLHEDADAFHADTSVLAFFDGRTHRRGVREDYEDLVRFVGAERDRGG